MSARARVQPAKDARYGRWRGTNLRMAETLARSESGPVYVSRANADEDAPFEYKSIDLERLAEEVIALLKRELRLERERRGTFSEWR